LTGEHMVVQCLLWATTLAFLSVFDFIAKKKLGADKQGYLNLRLPKFIALAISSLTAIASFFLLMNDLIEANVASYLSVPYFAATSYFIAAFFRAVKQERV